MIADSPDAVVAQVSHSLQVYLTELRDGGLEGLPASPVGMPVETRAAEPMPSPSDEPAHTPTIEPRNDSAAVPADPLAGVGSLDELRTALGPCQRCKLCEHRKTIVFGVGNPDPEVVFVGEGPGSDEDRQGEPFVGRAGQLLNDIITKGMHLRREDVYIANVVKCRPPDNRDPEPDEIAACEPFLQKQLALLRPKVIVALGRFAAQTLLADATPISRLRGQWRTYRGVKLMPTLHPAYLLRNPQAKRAVWEDIKSVLKEIGRR